MVGTKPMVRPRARSAIMRACTADIDVTSSSRRVGCRGLARSLGRDVRRLPVAARLAGLFACF